MTQQQDKTGGPAFPQSDVLYEDGAELVRTQHGGMTLRDWFAGQALSGYNCPLMEADVQWITQHGAVNAYRIADAMIAARNGGQDT